MPQPIYIKNMVSKRCIQTIQNILEEMRIPFNKVNLGCIEFQKPIEPALKNELKIAIQHAGFEILVDKEQQLIEQIKLAVLEMIYFGNNLNTIIRNSDYLSDKIGKSYAYISKHFSDTTGHTIEKYIILVKLERVKELLSYNEMTLSEISYQMGYSSVQHLSNQFKQVTGMSVSEFKALKIKPRTPLDELIP
jgi:AraC family transcriptional regulator